MKNDFELFKGKTMSALFQDIYTNQNQKKRKISDLINDVKDLIKTPGDIGNVGMLLRDLLDTSVRNDEHLLKLAQVAQKIMSADNKTVGDEGFLSAAEKEQLLRDAVSPIVTDADIAELQEEIADLTT